MITYVHAPLFAPKIQSLGSLCWEDLEPGSALSDKIDLITILLPRGEIFQLPMSAEEQYRWFFKEARPHFQTKPVRQLIQINPRLRQMQLFLDCLSDQPVVCELAKKRYLRMQEIIRNEEKAAMRA